MYSWYIASTHILSLPEQYADINHKVVLVYNYVYCCEADHVATYIPIHVIIVTTVNS